MAEWKNKCKNSAKWSISSLIGKNLTLTYDLCGKD